MNLVLDNTVEINGADQNEIGMVVSTWPLIFKFEVIGSDIHLCVLAPYIIYISREGHALGVML